MKHAIVNYVAEVGGGAGLGIAAIEAVPNKDNWVYVLTAVAPIILNAVLTVVKSIWGTPEERAAKRQERRLRRLEKK